MCTKLEHQLRVESFRYKIVQIFNLVKIGTQLFTTAASADSHTFAISLIFLQILVEIW